MVNVKNSVVQPKLLTHSESYKIWDNLICAERKRTRWLHLVVCGTVLTGFALAYLVNTSSHTSSVITNQMHKEKSNLTWEKYCFSPEQQPLLWNRKRTLVTVQFLVPWNVVLDF